MADKLTLTQAQAYALTDAFGCHRRAVMLHEQHRYAAAIGAEQDRDEALKEAGLPTFDELRALAYGEPE